MKKRTREEWNELVEDYIKSGLKQNEWCEKNNINRNTFSDLLYKLRKEQSSTSVEWIKLSKNSEIITNQEDSYLNENGMNKIEVKIDQFTINIATEFNELMFAKICKVLKSLC